MSETISDLLADHPADATAILDVDGGHLSYGGFRSFVDQTIAALNGFGIGRNNAVGIVVPNGPNAAALFAGVASAATAAPLNPNYRKEEFDFYLSDLDAKGLVVEAGQDSPAIEVALARGIPVLRLEDGRLVGEMSSSPGAPGPTVADDIALVLHTSGTTARPKIVPLTHKNVTASARNIANTLRLTPEDRCLNIMPLFHIHGLMGAVLSSLSAGACIVATPGFHAMKFFSWLDEHKPSWYSAVPTMHQTILARAGRNAEVVDRAQLRLIRSSSAALPPQVLCELEETFRCRVVESYGMTEAAHQMASNPLPPAARKPGTVGPAAGPEIGIMGEAGVLLDGGAIGEVVIRGSNVTAGYANHPEANAKAFTGGWFRTGDQGFLDSDGYLTITGRLKEIINRGGEKISPREVDEVLLDHPAVAQAVTFAMPHDKLGEEVAAAIQLAPEIEATTQEIREFASARLIDFKVPRKILFLDEIPKGPTGKVQRVGLAKRLGLS